MSCPSILYTLHSQIECAAEPSVAYSDASSGISAPSITDKVLYDSVVIKFGNSNIQDYLAKINPKKWC